MKWVTVNELSHATLNVLPDINMGEKTIYNYLNLNPNSIVHMKTKCFPMVIIII